MRRTLSVLLLLVSLSAVGCTGEEEQTPQQVLVAAPGATVGSRTSKVALDVRIDGGSQIAHFKGDGVFDFKSQRGRLVLDLSSLGLQGSTGTTEIVFNADVVFMKLPFDLPQLKARPWVKIDLSRLDEVRGIDVSRFRQIQSNDPTAALNYLRGVTDDVQVMGREELRGESTTRYKAVIDLEKAAREVATELREDISQIIKQLGSSTIDSDVWIDGEGRLRKLQYRVDLSKVDRPAEASEAEPSGILTATFELFDFGIEADVADPAPDQVTDLEDLVRGIPPRA